MKINNKKRDGVVLVSIIKDEAYYLDEFINYYLLIGFKKVIVYDNGSKDNSRDLIKKYEKEGSVILHRALGKERQKDVYNDALNKYGHKYRYFAFFDIDEFLRIDSYDANKEIDYEFYRYSNKNIGSLGINMFIFGSSNHITRPDGLVIENYLFRTPKNYHANYHTKCIVDSSKVLCMHNPHSPFLKHGYSFLLCNGNDAGLTKSLEVDDSHFIIYHYYTKSKEEYDKKKTKGDALQSKNVNNNIRILHPIEEIDKDSLYDDYLLKYVDKVKKMIY